MEHQDLLQTIAEVAAAFAGFTGVISVFGHSGSSRDNWSVHGARTIIEASLFTILFAFLPFVVHGFGAGSEATWRISSGCFLFLLAAGAFGGTRRVWRVAGAGNASPLSHSSLYAGITLTLGISMSALLLANVWGFSFGSPATVYLACLLGPLGVAGLTFLQMVVRASAL